MTLRFAHRYRDPSLSFLRAFLCSRQADAKRRALANPALDRNVATTLFNYPVAGRQPEPGSPAGFLGREERLTDVCLGFRVHSASRVPHR